jgi:ABC-2 type transport system permease protein
MVLFLMRGHHVPGTTFSLGSLTLPSIIGMSFALSGLLGVTGELTIDREDGPACSRRSRSASRWAR